MIINEQLKDGLIRHYSDKKVYIHGGFPEADYVEAVDGGEYEYTETDKPIPESQPKTEPIPEPITLAELDKQQKEIKANQLDMMEAIGELYMMQDGGATV